MRIKLMNNKGYTLVELLLAMAILAIVMAQVGNIIFSSTLLYRRGSGEVNLQADAQQVIKLFEELAVDCNKTITSDATSITISNQSVDYGSGAIAATNYKFILEPTSKVLYLQLDGSSGSVTQKVADNVKSIKLTKGDAYTKSSKAVFTVEMEKEVDQAGTKYTYTASKDIYFRNHIGSEDTGDGGSIVSASIPPSEGGGSEGPGTPPIDEDAIVIEAEILRNKVYNVADLIPADYNITATSFQMCDASGNFILPGVNGDYAGYNFSSKDADGKLNYTKIQATDNSIKTGTGATPYYFRSTDGSNVFLKVYQKDVALGLLVTNDSGTLHLDKYELDNVSFYSGSVGFETCVDTRTPQYITASGISLANCKEYQVTMYLKFGGDSLKNLDSKYKYFKITNGSSTLNPVSADIYDKWPNDEQYYFCDKEVVVPLVSTKVATGKGFKETGTLEKVSKYETGETRIYLAEGYDSAAYTDGKKITDLLDKNLFDKDNPFFKFNVSLNSKNGFDGIFIDEERNAIGVMAGMLNFDQTDASKVGCANNRLPKTARFYELGGEIFYEVKVIYEDGSVYDVKIVPEASCSEHPNGGCALSSTLSDKYNKNFVDSLSSSMESPNEYEEITDNGKKVLVFKGSTPTPAKGSSSGSGGGSASGGSSGDSGSKDGDESNDGGESSGGGETSGGGEPAGDVES